MQINDDWSWRYLIVFASRDVADGWWRAVTDSVKNGYAKFADVKRVNPQFYTHNPGIGPIASTITDEKCAGAFLGKVFFTLLPDRDGRALNVIPPIDIRDHISGQT